MKTKDWMEFLPPIPTLSQAVKMAQQDSATRKSVGGVELPTPEIVSLTEDDFKAALKGIVGEVTGDLTGVSFKPGLEVSGASSLLESLDRSALKAGEAETHDEVEMVAEDARLSKSDLDCYLTAAALRYTYRLHALTPIANATGNQLANYGALSGAAKDSVFSYLTSHSDIAKDALGNARWMLRDDARRSALKVLFESGNLPSAVEQARADAAAESAAEESREQNAADSTTDEASSDSAGTTVTIEDILWNYLTVNPLPLGEPDSGQLILTQQVVNWLYELSPKLTVPSPDSVARQLARESQIQPFRHLTGEWKDGKFRSYFVGRDEELMRLYDYLDVLPPASMRDKFKRAIFKFTSSTWEYLTGFVGHRPLLIHGPGGIGKSTLLAQFLLAHLTQTAVEDRFPYIYLDFDLSALNVREPITLLIEAARQMSAQYPSSQQIWESARNEWLAKIAEIESPVSPDVSPVERDTKIRTQALSEFAALIRQNENEGVMVAAQFQRGLPFLLVLDTFEEVQYHNRDDVKDVFRFLNAMSGELSSLRVILMGRAPLDDLAKEFQLIESAALESDHFGSGQATDFGVIEVPLGDLDTDTAREYLFDQGISDTELAEDLVQSLGANPLSLRLISAVVQKEKIDLTAMRKEITWKPGVSDRLFGRTIPPKALLQGVLFRRILGHIHNEKIRDLAHPGLILRRITPELIQRVLASPCGLGEITDQEAKGYFHALAKEVALVGTESEMGGEYVLKHRPELRRIMLRLMEADDTKETQIQQVHENAVDYYASEKGPLAREEELYHRLMIDRVLRTEELLDDITTEEAIAAGYAAPPPLATDARPMWRALVSAVDELPIKGQAYLAARLHRELITDEQLWRSVHQQDWEMMLLGRASRRARDHGNVLSALESLVNDVKQVQSEHGRLTRHSPLPIIEIALLERSLNFRQAVDKASTLRKELRLTESWRRGVACILLGARAAARFRDEDIALGFLSESHKTLDGAVSEASLTVSDEPALQVRRSARQWLRISVDCYQLLQSGAILEIAMWWLTRLADSTTLDQFPVLARYAVSAPFTGADHLAPPQATSALLESAREPKMLTLLLTNIPKVSTLKVAEALANWTQEALKNRIDTIAFAKLGNPPAANGIVGLRDYWRKLLLHRPDDVALQVPLIIMQSADISDARLTELLRNLAPQARAQGEDPFVEAQMRGDLIPGEGALIHSERQTKSAR